MKIEKEPISGQYGKFKIDGIDYRIYWEEAGQGIPLVCLHTAGSDGRQYRALLNDKKILEVKNTTLMREDDIAEFPDAVTSRGTKHLQKLKESIKKGYKPYVLFLTQIQGINNFRIAKDIDSTYYKEYLDAKKSGVSFLAYRCNLNSKEIKIEKKIKIIDE